MKNKSRQKIKNEKENKKTKSTFYCFDNEIWIVLLREWVQNLYDYTSNNSPDLFTTYLSELFLIPNHVYDYLQAWIESTCNFK